jgi:hypothetical protein
MPDSAALLSPCAVVEPVEFGICVDSNAPTGDALGALARLLRSLEARRLESSIVGIEPKCKREA